MSDIFQSRLPSTYDAAIAALKRTATQHQKTQQQLANNQDLIAKALGYLNWSMLHKHIANLSWQEIQEFGEILNNHPTLGPSLVANRSKVIKEDGAMAVMQSWVRKTFTPLARKLDLLAQRWT